MLAFIQQAVELGFSPLNIVLAVMLYFMGAHSGIFPQFWGKKEDKQPTIADLHLQVRKLQGYFNHETTERLDKIVDQNTKIITGVEDVKRKQNEYDRFGIKVRKLT